MTVNADNLRRYEQKLLDAEKTGSASAEGLQETVAKLRREVQKEESEILPHPA